jgi:hypothetical protein
MDIVGRSGTFLIALITSVGLGVAEDDRPAATQMPSNHNHSSDLSHPTKILGVPIPSFVDAIQKSQFELPNQPRVSRSHRPLRQITLRNGDRLVGECLDWGSQVASFRLQIGGVVAVPVAAIAAVENSPGEIDVLIEPFEKTSASGEHPVLESMLDESQAAGGQSSLRIDASFPEFRRVFEPPLASARIEFAFLVGRDGDLSTSGEWQIDWDNVNSEKPIVVCVDAGRSISVAASGSDKSPLSPPTLKLSEGWHSFIALIEADRTRLIVDDAILEARATPQGSVKALQFRTAGPPSKNVLWIDELQVQKLATMDLDRSPVTAINRDVLRTEAGDELFGKITGMTEKSVTFEIVGQTRSIPRNQLTALNWNQPTSVVHQSIVPKTGVVARLFMQSFVDRPECNPEEMTVTIRSVDSTHLAVQHPLIGDMTIRWSDVSRIEPLFFGQSLLIDARNFHLGNSIRTDLQRQWPDGTSLRGEFHLINIPNGQAYLSLAVAEIEASGTEAPRGSPYLAELRAGNLITEVSVNDHKLCSLNQLIRFKPLSGSPERVRIPIPPAILKLGHNTFQLRQKPLKPEGQDFDDGEIGNIRIDFEQLLKF